MTEARLVTREQLAAALHDMWELFASSGWTRDELADAITDALPAAAPAEGLREAWALLRALVEALDAMAGKVNIRGTAPDSVDLGLAFDAVADQARAALARHESAGSE